MPFDGGTKRKRQSTGQKNFAPVLPLQKIKNPNAHENSSLAELVRELHNYITNKDIEPRRQIAEVGRLCANLRSGKMMFKRDPIYGGMALIKPLPNRSRSDRHVVPLAQTNSSQLTSIWTLSRPRGTVRHFGNTNRAQIQHSLIETVLNHYDTEIFDELFHQQESLSMMDYGTAIIHPYYDDKLNTIFHTQPIIQNKKQTVFDGYGFCGACGHEGGPEEFESEEMPGMPMCPECESFNVPALVPQMAMDIDEVVGQKEIVQGDISAELRPVPACNWDMRFMVQDSPYYQYHSEVSQRLVESLLGVEVATEDADTDFGLHIVNAIGLRGGSVEGLGRENLYGFSSMAAATAIMWEDYYQPEMYTGIRLPKEEKTLSGETIPAGVPLEELFPDGLLCVGFNDMDVLTGVFNEKRRDISGVYHIQSHSGVGKGISDVIEVAEQLNIAHSAALASLKRYGAGGGYWYDADVMSKTEAANLLKPGGLVGLKMKGTNYSSVEQAIGQLRHNELNQSNLAMVAQLTNLMNVCFQTTEFTHGVADARVDVNTLGGQQLLKSQNQQRSAAPLRMKGWTRARLAEQFIELFRENIQIPKFFGTTDKFALVKGRFITGADMPDYIKCDFVQDSEIPTNTLTKRQAAEQMLEKSQYFGMSFAELLQINPRIAMWWAQKFGVDDMPMANQTEILIVCQDRLDNLKELAEGEEMIAQISGFNPDPHEAAQMLIGQLTRKVALSEENHAIKASILQEYLDDDEVSDWSPKLLASVEALIQLHYTYDRDNRFRVPALDQEGQIMLAAQAQMAQQQMMATQQMEQQQQMAAEQEQGMVQEGLGKAVEQIQKEDDFMREQEGKELDHERDKEMEQMRLEGRSAMAKNNSSRGK